MGPRMNQQAPITWTTVWAVVAASAEKRLGRPLLRAHLLLAIVAASVVALHWS